MTYKMNEFLGTERFHRIYEGKKWVGRVYFNSITGKWVGRIGDFEASGSTAMWAFAEVGARVLGFRSAEELDAHNRAIRRKNQATRLRVKESIAQILYGATAEERISALDDLFEAGVRR